MIQKRVLNALGIPSSLQTPEKGLSAALRSSLLTAAHKECASFVG